MEKENEQENQLNTSAASEIGPANQSYEVFRSFSDEKFDDSDISDEDFLEDTKKILADAMLQQNSGKEEYLSACSSRGIVPSSLVIENLVKDELNLRHMLLLDNGCSAIACGLRVNKYIQRLNLSSNGISDQGGLQLAAALQENVTITFLDLSSNALTNESGAALARMLRTNCALTELSLAKNRLSNLFAQALVEALTPSQSNSRGNRQLKVLDISGNKITKRGGADLARMFEVHDAHLPSHFNIGWNDLGGDGSLMFLKATLNFPRLVSLEIPFNGLTDVVAEVWEDFLKHSSLVHLDISRNRLGMDTALGIAAALKENVNLQVLKIGWNPLGTKGTKAMILSLNENMSLETLRIENTCQSGEEQEVIEEADNIMLSRNVLTTIVCEYPERDRVHATNVPQIKDSMLSKMSSKVKTKMSPRLSKMTECSPRK